MAYLVEPKETVTLKSFVSSTIALDAATEPVSKESSEPPPLAWAGGEERGTLRGTQHETAGCLRR